MWNIKNIKDESVVAGLRRLADKEHEVTMQVLVYLAEVDSRGLYRDKGYRSLFSYMTTELGYSESSAQRRIVGARCIRECPQVLEMIKNREVNLSTVSCFAKSLNEDNQQDLLNLVRNKSKREVEQIVASYNPRPSLPKEQVKPVAVVTPKIEKTPLLELSPQVEKVKQDAEIHFRQSKSEPPPVVEERFELKFSGGKEFMAKVNQAKVLFSGKYPKGASLEELFTECLESFIKAKTAKPKRKSKKSNYDSRYIPVHIKDEIRERDGNCCTYVSPEGKRCGSNWNLQFDHIKPFGIGGKTEVRNLRLLCASHNQLMAEKTFGRENILPRR